MVASPATGSPASSVTTAVTSLTPGKPSAAATTSRYGALTATIRARESARISAMPSARSMVETGTGTAPIRIAARYTTTNSGESAMTITTRCSACRPRPRRPPAARATRAASSA